MKTHALEWPTIQSGGTALTRNPVGRLNGVLHLATRAFLAMVPALAIVVGAAWLVTVPDLVVYLQATLWASGFVFLALAVDSQKPVNGLNLAIGVALPALALLSSHVSVEIAIVAAVLVAGWTATAIWRR